MKHIYKLIAGVLFLSLGITQVTGQDIMDVPAVDDQGDPALVNTIYGDTTETGERANLNRIYRLERDGIYVLSAKIRVSYPLRLIAAEGSGRPPMIVRGQEADGTNHNNMMGFMSNSTEHSFIDIIFQGVNLDRQHSGEDWFSGMVVIGDTVSVKFTRCIFNGFTANAFSTYGDETSAYFRDCVFRNFLSNKHPYEGQQVLMGKEKLDTLIVTNCTSFNNNSYWLTHSNVADFVVIEHNTIYASLVRALGMPYLVNGNIRSNLFYATSVYGHDTVSTISIQEVPPDDLSETGLTEADRIVNVTHNAFFWPQKSKDYWTDYADDVVEPVWMRAETQAIFEDNDTWPYIHESNNLEMDPLFSDNAMDTWVIDELSNWCRESRDTDTDTIGWGVYTGDRNYDVHMNANDDPAFTLVWPLPENMEYTDATLLTAGHDGLPVGNLNWDQALRAQYTEPLQIDPTTVGIREAVAQPDNQLSHIYPNPFHSKITIYLSLPAPGITTLKVYNIEGQEVATLVNHQLLNAGSHNFDLDADQLASGIYFYQLKWNQRTDIKKMVLMK
ncbi:MAG: T9SS type A sorting domain-containing protein [Bacteroidota bacterium]